MKNNDRYWDCLDQAMEATQVCGAVAATAEAEAKAARERAETGDRSLSAREGELTARIALLRERRIGARGQVERSLAELYERIAARKRPAVVTVTRGICTGCRVDIPPQTWVASIASRMRVSQTEIASRAWSISRSSAV